MDHYKVFTTFVETICNGWSGRAVLWTIINFFTSPVDKYLQRDCPTSVFKVFSE